METDFNAYKDSYGQEVQRSVGFIGQKADFYMQVKADALVDIARRHLTDPENAAALDVGCGPGITDRLLVDRFHHITGVDIADEIIETAQAANPTVSYQSYDGSRLPFADSAFDLTFAICVLHHVPPEQWEGFLGEMKRVTRPEGLIVIFEHNPLNPLTRLAVRRCGFDKGAVLIPKQRLHSLVTDGGLTAVEESFILCFPFAGAVFRIIEHSLRAVPLGAQYYIAARRSE